MTASETWARLPPDEISTCPLCREEHTNAYIALKVRDFEHRQRNAIEKMRQAELDRLTHRGHGVGSGPDTRREVRRLTDLGWSIRAIAEELSVSESTVKKARQATRG